MTATGGPNHLAAVLTAKIAEIEAQREVADTRQERRDLSRRLHQNCELLRWGRTRAGYRAEVSSTSVDADDTKEDEA